jgi:hypothetical protein
MRVAWSASPEMRAKISLGRPISAPRLQHDAVEAETRCYDDRRPQHQVTGERHLARRSDDAN